MERSGKQQRSLLTLLSVIVVLFVSLVFFLYAWHSYVVQRDKIVDSMKSQAAESISRLTGNLGFFIEAYAVNEYDKLVLTELQLKHHFAIIVHDFKLGEIMGQKSYVSGKIIREDGFIYDYDNADSKQQAAIKSAFFSDSSNVYSATGELLGEISVYITDEEIRKELRRIFLDTLMSSLMMALLLIGLLFFFTSRLLILPLKKISNELKNQDDNGIPVSPLPGFAFQEMSTFSRAINSMLEEIRSSRNSLQQEHTRLQNVIDGTQVGTWEWDIATGECLINTRWAELIGYKPEELQPVSYQAFRRLVHPQDVSPADKMLEKHFSGKAEFYECEMRMLHKLGHYVWVMNRGKVFSWNHEGKPQKMSGTLQDISRRKHQTRRTEVLLDLPRLADRLSETEFLQKGLQLIEELTQSQISFIHSLHNDQTTLELVTWSKQTLDHYCQAEHQNHYSVKNAGIWADAIRKQQAQVINDYKGLDGQDHLPDGHAELERFITLPVIEKGRVEMLLGVANKQAEYIEIDVDSVSLVANEIWRIIKHRRAEQAQLKSEKDLKAERDLFIGGPVAVLVRRYESGWPLVYASPNVEQVFGYTKDEMTSRNFSFKEVVHPEDFKRIEKSVQNHLDSGHSSWEQRYRLLNRDGDYRWVYDFSVTEQEINGKNKLIRGYLIDETRRVTDEEQLKQAASVFRYAREGIMLTDKDGCLIDVNKAFTQITGYARDEIIGQNPRLLQSGRHDRKFYQNMWKQLADKGYWSGEIWNRRRNGEIFAELLTISAVRDENGSISNYVALFSDITSLKEHESQLEHLAHYDALTDLPNRVLLGDRLRQAMALELRRKKCLAVVFLDLDGFKEVNDLYGHAVGDKLLIAVSRRINRELRQSDTLARLGGDEFVAVLPDLSDKEDSVKLLTRILDAVAATLVEVEIPGYRHEPVSASLGVTFFPQSEEVDADQLLRQADQAMYQAKLSGKNRYHFFDAELDRNLRGQHQSVEHIRQALNEDQLELYYQPKVNMRLGEVVGMEALIRWQHPEQGLLAPGAFLPLIEDHPLIVEIGEWTLRQAMIQMQQWQQDGLDLSVSVNMSARHLQQNNFVDNLKSLLSAYPQVTAEKLQLEVLETSALDDKNLVSQLIEECQQLGVSFALDDFGTGYSSLSYLKQLPAKVLKIDQSFVRDMLKDPDDLSILEGVISLASAFHREVIAEGVETLEHGELLLWLGCELGQGYGISRPMPASQVKNWMAEWSPDPIWLSCKTVNRDKLPLIFALVEHRSWVASFEAYLNDELPEPEFMDHERCQFHDWLEKAVQQSNLKSVNSLGKLHKEIHHEARLIQELKLKGQIGAAHSQIPELLHLRDQLIQELQKFINS